MTTKRRIALLSDIHGSVRGFQAAINKAVQAGAQALIQLGDFGVYKFCWVELTQVAAASPIPIYFIDGNHEDFRLLAQLTIGGGDDIVNVAPNLFYIRRGSVVEIEGHRIAALGGAASIDKLWRQTGVDWFPEELITEEQVEPLLKHQNVDFMISHTPTQSCIDFAFNSGDRWVQVASMFGVPLSWRDPSATFVEDAWKAQGKPPLYCGHMHDSKTWETVRVLRIEELVYIDD